MSRDSSTSESRNKDIHGNEVQSMAEDGEESEMQWKRTAGQARLHLQAYKDKMLTALEIGQERGAFEFKKTNLKSMWRVLDVHASKNEMKFMGIQAFRGWVQMSRKQQLKKEWSAVIDHFHNEYV